MEPTEQLVLCAVSLLPLSPSVSVKSFRTLLSVRLDWTSSSHPKQKVQSMPGRALTAGCGSDPPQRRNELHAVISGTLFSGFDGRPTALSAEKQRCRQTGPDQTRPGSRGRRRGRNWARPGGKYQLRYVRQQEVQSEHSSDKTQRDEGSVNATQATPTG